jgi:predicted O-methyltransferase YrrM
MVRWFEPGMIIELGTGLGISTLYLAAGSPVTPLHTVEGQPSRADFSAHLIKRCGFFSVKVHVGEIGEVLDRLPEAGEKRFLAFVDGNHQYGPTVTYLRKLIEMAGEETVVIMDDIYWSRGMHRAWREIISWQEVRASIDLFHVGILWLRKDLAKTKLKMKF